MRQDRRADRDGDAELTAYNERLAALARRDATLAADVGRMPYAPSPVPPRTVLPGGAAGLELAARAHATTRRGAGPR